MTALALMDDLGRRGVRLSASGGRLIVDAPVGAVTRADREQLLRCKPGLIALLESRVERAKVPIWAELPGGRVVPVDPRVGMPADAIGWCREGAHGGRWEPASTSPVPMAPREPATRPSRAGRRGDRRDGPRLDLDYVYAGAGRPRGGGVP